MKTNRRLTVLAVATVAVSIAAAMPSKSEFAKAQPIVNELMNPFISGYKAKKNTAAEVGAKAVEYAREAETEAAKFLLLKGAITYYSRAEEYDKAADAVDELGRAVKDIPPDTMLDIISRATSRISEANAPRLHAQYRLASTRAQAGKEVAKMKALVAKRPADDTIRRRYAEALAALGNWSVALDEFAKVKGKTGEIAAAEKSGKGISGDIASFWWDYEPEEQYASEAIKRHSVEFYKKALADGSISGLKKTLAEKRVASLGPVVESGAAAAAAAPAFEPAKPAVAEIKPEPKRTEVASKPAPAVPASAKGGRWTLPKTFQTPLERSLDLGGGVTMPFCACPAGSFRMMDHKVTITRPFWIAKTPITLFQLMSLPKWKSYVSPGCRVNAEKVAKEFKGKFITLAFSPEQFKAIINEFGQKYLGVLPPGYIFRLPTEAEFFYAFCEGQDDYNYNFGLVDGDWATNAGEALVELGWIPRADRWDFRTLPREYGWMRLGNLPEANKFGVVPWRTGGQGYQFLDKINMDKKGYTGDLFPAEHKEVMMYSDEEIDPLKFGSVALYGCGGGFPREKRWWTRGGSGYALIVIGPDLEAEKKAAKK